MRQAVFHGPKRNIRPISNSCRSVLRIPSLTLAQIIGSTIRKAANGGIWLPRSQTSAKIMKEATGVALIIPSRGLTSACRKDDALVSTARKNGRYHSCQIAGHDPQKRSGRNKPKSPSPAEAAKGGPKPARGREPEAPGPTHSDTNFPHGDAQKRIAAHFFQQRETGPSVNGCSRSHHQALLLRWILRSL